LTGQTHPGASGAGPQILASDADRDRAAELLNAAFAEGRLTAGEHGERVRAAYAARSWQQLRELTADLPAQDQVAARPAAGPGMFAGVDWCLLCLLVIVCPPAGIAWLVAAWRRCHACPALAPVAAAGAAELPQPGSPGRC
jgi:hypothetical protein